MTKMACASACAALLLFAAARPRAGALNCDLADYKAADGLTASIEGDTLAVSWAGDRGTEVRARYAIDGGQPVIRDLGIRKTGGQWTSLGRNLVPEYRVTTGVRRMTEQQAQPLRDAGVQVTQEVIDKNRWYAFWDSPLYIHDGPERRVLGGPRNASEIRRATATFSAGPCRVQQGGAAHGGHFPGPSVGVFT